MKMLAFSAILALFAIASSSASAPLEARQAAAAIAVYVLTGNAPAPYAPYLNFTISIPEDGVTIPISRFPLPLTHVKRHQVCQTLEHGIDMTDNGLTFSEPLNRILHLTNRGPFSRPPTVLPPSQLHLHSRRRHQGLRHEHVRHHPAESGLGVLLPGHRHLDRPVGPVSLVYGSRLDCSCHFFSSCDQPRTAVPHCDGALLCTWYDWSVRVCICRSECDGRDNGKSVVLFTGGAGRITRSFAASVAVLLGVVAAL